MPDLYRTITACRACGSARLESVLDLGCLAVSDFVRPGEHEDKAPLELVVCLDCSLVQLRHTVSRDHLYREQYWYRSGVNQTMVAALQDVVDDALRQVDLYPGDRVLDLGCNDGTMLRLYPRFLYRDGYEPSPLAEQAREGTDLILPDYWPPKRPPEQRYHVITSIAMFYSVERINEFVTAIKQALHPRGVWLVQFQDLHAMLACNGFDNICAEHLAYWSVEAFSNLLAHHDLCIADVSHNEVNGGSVRYSVRHGNTPSEAGGVQAFYSSVQLRSFAHKAKELREQTLALLRDLKAQGRTIYGMGASTKANTLLQYYGIGPELITAFGERSPEKWGRQTVGTHIPIISEADVLAAKPDYLWIGPWHFLASFRERYAAWERAGGQWIVPLPELYTTGGAPCPSSVGDNFGKVSASVI